MIALPKVLVVDDGQRRGLDLLSTELAELGVSSVTASVEAAHDVLGVIERPAAIFLKMPLPQAPEHAAFARLASELKTQERTLGIPLIEWDRDSALAPGGLSAVLRAEIGPQAVFGPEV